MTPALEAELGHDFKHEGGGPLWKAAMRKLGADGWIGLGWKKPTAARRNPRSSNTSSFLKS